MEKLMIVDGNSLLFRAYYATAYGQMMKTSTGIPTNAVFAFTGMFLKALEIIEPTHVVVAFDAGKHTFRHELYPDYKGGRKECPEELVPQFKLVRDMLEAWPVKWLEIPDIEADDIIGTLSKKYPDVETHILSSDHDLLQLIDDSTLVWMIRKGMKEIDQMTTQALKEQMGIEPLQIIELKGLMGDNSDNIPGIPGVGEKTALKLLADYHDVENLLAHTDELKGKLKEKVENGRESALMSKTLATIKTDAPIDLKLDDCRYGVDPESLVNFFRSLEMNVYVRRFEGLRRTDTTSVTEDTTDKKKEMVKVDHIPESFYKNEYICLVDADEAHFMDATVYGLGLSNGEDAYYISIDDAKKDEVLLDHLAKDHLIGIDIKRAYHLAKCTGIVLNYQDDAWLAAFLADGSGANFDKLLEKEGLSLSLTNEDVYGKADRPKMPDEDGQIQHMQEMVNVAQTLMSASVEKIREQDIEQLYRNLELPLSYTLFKMEEEGIRVDLKVLDEIAEDTSRRLNNLSSSIYEMTGKEFNINSPKQLASVLFDDLGLPGGKKRSTNIEVLEKLVGMHPVIEVLMEYRKLQKIYSTYAEGLKKYVKPDGKIHTIYNQCLTATGRLSSSDPNLQNISVRDEEGKEIRKAFTADEGHILVSSDYSQIELRMLAHMAKEERLISAFTSGIDAHTKTAMDIFGVQADEVTSLMRRKAKAVNFGIVYGISDFGLAQQLGIFRNEAKEIIDLYFLTYPGIRTFMDETVRSCQENGYVKTLLNRRRYIPEIRDKNHMVKEFGKRAAMNAPIQGSAADLIKLAMLKIDRMMQDKQVKSRMILQVHDELIFNVCEEEMDIMKQIIKEGMESAMELSVPLVQETNTGFTWYEAK